MSVSPRPRVTRSRVNPHPLILNPRPRGLLGWFIVTAVVAVAAAITLLLAVLVAPDADGMSAPRTAGLYSLCGTFWIGTLLYAATEALRALNESRTVTLGTTPIPKESVQALDHALKNADPTAIQFLAHLDDFRTGPTPRPSTERAWERALTRRTDTGRIIALALTHQQFELYLAFALLETTHIPPQRLQDEILAAIASPSAEPAAEAMAATLRAALAAYDDLSAPTAHDRAELNAVISATEASVTAAARRGREHLDQPLAEVENRLRASSANDQLGFQLTLDRDNVTSLRSVVTASEQRLPQRLMETLWTAERQRLLAAAEQAVQQAETDGEDEKARTTLHIASRLAAGRGAGSGLDLS